MTGLLNINKPCGMSSRRVVDIVARQYSVDRVGHAGTLDPLASGVLIVCVGWATRLVPWIQDRTKTYRARFRLGCRSNTDDSTGELTETAGVTCPTQADVASALTTFLGTIRQVPPQFSAVHVAGRRAHDLARRGKAVALEPRLVRIHRLELLRFEYPDLDV